MLMAFHIARLIDIEQCRAYLTIFENQEFKNQEFKNQEFKNRK